MAVHNTNQEENFRQTGKFKPILDQPHSNSSPKNLPSFQVVSLQSVGINFAIPTSSENVQCPRLWRLYFQDNFGTIDHELIIKTVQNVFAHLARTQQLQQNLSGVNACNVVIERVKLTSLAFITSSLDYNCIIVVQGARQNVQGEAIYFLDCYQVQIEIPHPDKQFREQIYIQSKDDYQKYYLLKKKQTFYMVKDIVQQSPILQLTDQNLQQSVVEHDKNTLVIKNLSPRIISIKFTDQKNYSKNTQPLRIVFANLELFQAVLFKINRVKHLKHKVEETEGKQWHSFDHKTQVDSKKESKTTPQKSKNHRLQMASAVLYKASNRSTNNLQAANQTKKVNKVVMMNNQRNMKISQRVVTNPKQSNLVPSQLDYPVSVKDEKQKESGYFDQFENLLYEEQVEQKQLALNDSFQEFEKKENSVKQLEIINELNRRKAKQNQQKKLLDSLKQKIKQLMNEQKEWINKNFKLKLEIKKIKNEGKNQSNKQLQDMKQKISELKSYQHSLIQELNKMRSHNNLEVLVFGTSSTPQSSQRAANQQHKIFQSYNAFNSNSLSGLQLNTSIRSNNSPISPLKAPQQSFVSPSPVSKSGGANMQYNFRQNLPKQNNYQNPNLFYPPPSPSGVSLCSSLQGQGLIQHTSGNNYQNPNFYSTTGNTPGIQNPPISNDCYGLQGRSIPNQGFTGQLNFANKGSVQGSKRVYPQFNSNMKNL